MDLTPFLVICGIAIFALLVRGAVDWWAGPEADQADDDVTIGGSRNGR